MAKLRRIKNQLVSNSTELRSESTATCGKNHRGVRQESTAEPNPTKQEPDFSALLKNKVLNVETTTTDDDLRIPIPSSSSLKRIPSPPTREPATPIQEFHQRLYRTFQSAGKPTPLLSQSETALAALNDDWKGFLEWLPTAPQFAACRTPGGLPTLIQFFQEQPATKETSLPLPAPCPKCRELGGRILKRASHPNGQTYSGVTECDCALGQALRAGRERLKAESARRNEKYRGFRDLSECAEGMTDEQTSVEEDR